MADRPPQQQPPTSGVAGDGSSAGGAEPPKMSIDAQREQLAQQADVMFSKIGAYMEAELGVVKEDYLLLQHMNKLAKTNYADMSQLTEHLNVLMTSLQEKYALFEPYLEQIDKVDENIAQLEEATRRLDEYSKQLEARFKKLLRT